MAAVFVNESSETLLHEIYDPHTHNIRVLFGLINRWEVLI
jgi:hypothetical protein